MAQDTLPTEYREAVGASASTAGGCTYTASVQSARRLNPTALPPQTFLGADAPATVAPL